MTADIFRLGLPLMRMLPPELAHTLTVKALGSGFLPLPPHAPVHQALEVSLWGHRFSNPIGIAAGFDKNAEAYAAMLQLGFGFVEVGTVTPKPQSGNPKPRVFRLPNDQAVINRLGFNGKGMHCVADNLYGRNHCAGIVGVNIGKNKTTVDAVKDYKKAAAHVGGLADYVVINVSSPNTPGLRDLQNTDSITTLVRCVREALPNKAIPVLVKIAPDLDTEGLDGVLQGCLDAQVDGIVVSNTTIARPQALRSLNAKEPGGLSGAPLFALSTEMLHRVYLRTHGLVPLIGVGGISNGHDAYAKIRAGASLVQLYTALIYHGPALLQRINRELIAHLLEDGFTSITQAVGADHR